MLHPQHFQKILNDRLLQGIIDDKKLILVISSN